VKTYAITVNAGKDEEFTMYDGFQFFSMGVMKDIEWMKKLYPDWTSMTLTIVRSHAKNA